MAPSYASGRRTVRPVAHQILVAIASATMVSFAASATATLRSAAWVAPRKNRPALTCAPCGLGKPLLYEGGSIEKDGASDISIPQPMSRRLPLVGAAALLACACGFCSRIAPAKAETQLVVPPADKLQQYDQPRDKQRDAGFAQGMATGMADYEQAVSKKKRPLFDRLLKALPRKDATIVEVGMGSFPNAAYFSAKNTPEQMDIIGVDPNDSMEKFARESAKKVGNSFSMSMLFLKRMMGWRSSKSVGLLIKWHVLMGVAWIGGLLRQSKPGASLLLMVSIMS
eukprot:TRINITY_DN39541_c0_g1_i1.p1 TRINITY_DN39541_c0_g1~~TRINITY_DN39541_c0_g1_i1.p1  ORF type:complete len:283 (-),score=47.10 TRINITY_DN39541_c0_g1_i1:103-951(-)